MDWKYPFSYDEFMKAKSRVSSDIRIQGIDVGFGNFFLRCKVRSAPTNIFDITNNYLSDNYIPVDPYSFLVLREKDIGKISKSYEFQFEQFIPTDLGVVGYVNAHAINDVFVEIAIGTYGFYIMFDKDGCESNIKYERVREFIASLANYLENLFSSKKEFEIYFKLSDKDRKPNERTQERYELFRKLKEMHPTWSQAKVAMETCKDLGEIVTEDTVRNTYRSLGLKWDRGDRVR